jgi:hypothetical protein
MKKPVKSDSQEDSPIREGNRWLLLFSYTY